MFPGVGGVVNHLIANPLFFELPFQADRRGSKLTGSLTPFLLKQRKANTGECSRLELDFQNLISKVDYAFVLGIFYCYISLQSWLEVGVSKGLSFPRRAPCRVTGLLWFVIHSLPYARFSISDDPIDPIPSFSLPKSDYPSARRGIQLEFPERAG